MIIVSISIVFIISLSFKSIIRVLFSHFSVSVLRSEHNCRSTNGDLSIVATCSGL